MTPRLSSRRRAFRVRSACCAALASLSLATPKLAAQNPPPVPPVPVPAQNPITEAKRVLGKILFWDEQLSSDNTVACGTCHLTEFGGADPRHAIHPGLDANFGTADDTVGSPGVIASDAQNDYEDSALFGFATQVTRRNAPNFFGALWAPTQFWDGRAARTFVDPETGVVRIQNGGSLESQVAGPPVSDAEMAHRDRDWTEITRKLVGAAPLRLASNLPNDVAAALAGGRSYPDLFTTAFGDGAITATRIAFAIATYERTLVANQTPWDLFNAGNPNALTQGQQAGLNFFRTSVCSQCHVPPLFTDNGFHNIGLRPTQEDLGRQEVTGQVQDRGRFKTPSLRNVGLRANLMHVGWIEDVRDALDFYRSNRQGGTGHVQFADNRDPRVGNIAIPGNVLPALADFLSNGLTDPRVASGSFPFDRPTLWSERASGHPTLFGAPTAGSGGLAPSMLATSPLVIRNPDFRIGVHGALGGANAALVLSTARATPGTAFGPLGIHVELAAPAFLLAAPVQLGGALGVPGMGFGTWKLPLRDDPNAVGLDLVGQWFVFDASGPLGLAASAGAEWTVL